MTKLERIILNTHPLRYIKNKSKNWILPGFEGVPVYEVMKFFRQQLHTSGLTERASAIAYNFVMSIPPTCLFLFTMIPALPFVSKPNLKNEFRSLIMDVFPSSTSDNAVVKFVIDFIDHSRIGLISFSFIVSLFFASNAMMGVMRSFNRNYIGFEKRKGLHKRWVAIKLTVLLFGLLLSCLFLLISQSNLLHWIGIKNKMVRDSIVYGRWILIIALVYYSYGFIYKYAPATQKRWHIASPGAMLATVLTFIAMIAFSFFVNRFGTYDVFFGSIGTIIILMSMIYINSLTVLIGFEFNVSIKSLRAMAELREREEKAKASINVT